MATQMLITSMAMALAGGFAEKNLVPPSMIYLTEPSLIGPPRAFGCVVATLTVTFMWLLTHSMAVGDARTKYKTLASKDGEKDVELRYSLPNLYVDGTSKNAKAFNCVQRSHQQILETLTMYVFTACAAGIQFPIVTTIICALSLVSRRQWVKGYVESEGDSTKRYSLAFSKFFWQGIFALSFLSFASAGHMIFY
jgi:hypothetical protein